MSRFDQTEINLREDCWFLIDTQWLNQWGEYMQVCEPHDDDGKYLFFAHAQSLEYRQVGVLKHKPLATFTETHLDPGITALPLELGHDTLTEHLVQHQAAEFDPFRGGFR